MKVAGDREEAWAKGLVRAARNVLDRFKSGHHPSEGQLERLEQALAPWEFVLKCGHVAADDCDCAAGPATGDK